MSKTESAVFSVHIRGTIEAVWAEITQTARPQWAMYGTMLRIRGFEVGAAYQARSMDGEVVNHLGEILACEPPHLLQMSLRYTMYDDPPITMTWELAEADEGGVHLTLTFDGLPPGSKTDTDVRGSGGGVFIANTVKQMVENGRPSLSTRWMYRIAGWIGQERMLPKRCRSEHWPFEG